jgi:hypothetical protein
VRLSVDWEDAPAASAIAGFNAMLVNRGLEPLELALPDAELPTVTLRVHQAPWRLIADHLAQLLNLRREGARLVGGSER